MKSGVEFTWWKLEIIIDYVLEESFSWKLYDLGINRISIEQKIDNLSESKLSIWLTYSEWSENDLDLLIENLRPLTKQFGLELPSYNRVKIKDEDWSISWKKDWKPDPVGNEFLILPAWLDVPHDQSNRVVIRLDPGSAFGTGSHPTTRLCLEAIEKIPLSGKKLADLGCGSGILSLAAIKKGSEKVFAVDIDSLAVRSTIENRRLNNIDKDLLQVELGSIEVLELILNKHPVDFLICNTLAPVIEKLAPNFGKVVSKTGKVFLSGLLIDQYSWLEKILLSFGWKVNNLEKKDSWGLICISRK